jgi:ketosteroid isomerase-like protein
MMKLTLISVLIIASAATIAAQPGDTKRKQARLDDRMLLLQMEQEWVEAIKAGNAAWFERNFADDATEISSGSGTLKTKAADLADFKADKTVYESLKLSNLRIRIEGNAAVVTGTNRIRGHDEQGQAFDVRLAFTDTYIKRNGRWQVWAAQHTRIKP